MSLFRHRTSQPSGLATIYRADGRGDVRQRHSGGPLTFEQRAAQPRDDRFGSKCEELNVSRFSPLCPIERTSMRRAANSLMGQERSYEVIACVLDDRV